MVENRKKKAIYLTAVITTRGPDKNNQYSFKIYLNATGTFLFKRLIDKYLVSLAKILIKMWQKLHLKPCGLLSFAE